MRSPERIDREVRQRALQSLEADPLNPINLYNITWKDSDGEVVHEVVPPELTGVDAPIVVMSGRRFPSGSHKVGAAYSIIIEKQLSGEAVPGDTRVILPSTGNFGIGGAWVGPRMGYRSLVVLPEDMSAERYERITGYGAEIIRTPGCESNVKEIYDKVKELRADPQNIICNQFEEMGNYRFHYHVTGNAALDLAEHLKQRGIGSGRIGAFVSAMGSAGTIGAADRIKAAHPNSQTVGVEPIQCPTLWNCGYGGHRIEGIGDKHVTWIHHVTAMDHLICIDDAESVRGLQLIQEGNEWASEALGVDLAHLKGLFGVSGICNVLAAIKTARALQLTADDVVVTVATDSFDRYPSVLEDQVRREGPLMRDDALRLVELFHRQSTDWVMEGTREVRRRWHNQKYYTWVEQQNRTVEDLDAQLSYEWWAMEAAKAEDIDRRLLEVR
jgi:cysteine synthase A